MGSELLQSRGFLFFAPSRIRYIAAGCISSASVVGMLDVSSSLVYIDIVLRSVGILITPMHLEGRGVKAVAPEKRVSKKHTCYSTGLPFKYCPF